MQALYKYLPPDRQSYFTDSFLRFSQPGALNDPFEFLPSIPLSVLSEALRHIRKELLTPPAHAPGTTREERRRADREYVRRARQKLPDLPDPTEMKLKFLDIGRSNIDAKLGVLSLSRRWNSSLMWSHYTESHAGFCVGFDRNHEFFQQSRRRARGEFCCEPVRYSSTRPAVEFRRMTEAEGFLLILTKALDWKYEEEERALAMLAHADKTINASPFPIALFRVPHEAILDITLGLRVDAGLAQKAATLCKTLEVPLYRAKLSDTEYDFERERVEA